MYLRRQLRAKRILFKVFHNRGHPGAWFGLERWDYTALMEVAYRTDLLADEAMEKCVEVSTPGLLGRRRWRLFDGDVEIVGPIRRSVLAVRADETSARYMLVEAKLRKCIWNAGGRLSELQVGWFRGCSSLSFSLIGGLSSLTRSRRDRRKIQREPTSVPVDTQRRSYTFFCTALRRRL